MPSVWELVSTREFIDAAVETKADAILISSIYGMGILDCEGFRDKCERLAKKHPALYWRHTHDRGLGMGGCGKEVQRDGF